MSAQHAPTPWTVYDAGSEGYPGIDAGWRSIVMFGSADEECGVRGDTHAEAEANARFIVRAVNCHDELLTHLIAAVDALEAFGVQNGGIPEMKAAIAKARGEVA